MWRITDFRHKSGIRHTRVGDIVIRGYLLSIQQGSEAKRLAIGFGSGASELTTAVEGFQMTPQGLRKVGSGTVESGGSKTPGAALGVAGLIATSGTVVRGLAECDFELKRNRQELTSREIRARDWRARPVSPRV